MAMTMNEKLLVVWILAVVGTGLLLHHFLSWTIYAFQRVIAFSVFPMPGLVKFAAVVWCVNLLP
jgi:hypothetical protein